jgi:precorrin-6x reductase
MTAKIDALLAEVQAMPEFIAELAISPKRPQELMEGLERALIAVGRRADEDPAVVEIYDEVMFTIGRRDLATKEKLSALSRLFLRALDITKKVH